MIPFPDKKYDIIYADPPWQHDGNMGFPVPEKDVLLYKQRAEEHYTTMPTEEISALPVSNLTSDDCLLFLWISSSMFQEAIQIGNAWGFQYRTVGFVWDAVQIVPGFYTLAQCQLCLIFKKGNIPKPRGKQNIKQFLSCKRGRHSDKPDEVRHRITEMFPTQLKIELFARVNGMLFPPMQGWDYWGDEA